MTYPPYLREKARELRGNKGLTIDEIADRLAVSRTTVFYWVRDMARPERCRARPGPASQIGSRAMQMKHKRLREQACDLGYWEFPRLEREPTFRDFVCMYVAEGYKRDRNCVSLGNSDPAVIRLANHWITWFSKNRIDYRVHHHADQDPDLLAVFWANELSIDPAEVAFQRKSNSGQLQTRIWRCKHGVMAVRASDTIFRARLQGWMNRLEELWLDS